MFEINNCKEEMNSTISSFVQDIKNIRTGRVSPDILKNLTVDSYGAKMAIPQLSNINNLDNMTLSINLWDSSLVSSRISSILLIIFSPKLCSLFYNAVTITFICVILAQYNCFYTNHI